ncbi:2OG-Fe dioxygenase family protein [Marilutibacter chinensis]|uniref:2OG-Fe dioxygenase family protein n=1 Tax=Marilutibacter chinensis TaxID=2912247 RepID=A0ABS9HV77_9GAMM|nr:2OG-Fe dioxygenase family protein [Lysobacter chinensis]MCF7222109.1 2OG-Fe dioxygenase family protein [Lysobacter chinensis]
MHEPSDPDPARAARIHDTLMRGQGFDFVEAATMRDWLAGTGPLDDWERFTASWDGLAPDAYLAMHGKHRRRRHAVFSLDGIGAEAPAIRRQPHQPHYQSLDYNPLQGDIERWFEPVEDAVADSHSLRTILRHCQMFFGALAPRVRRWRTEVHQFRIEARAGTPGQPTPEGLHRDGVDYVLVLLIDRRNIASGTTSIHALDGHEIGHFTLTRPFDAALVDDRRVYHGVTAVEALDPARPAHRDVLVVTLRADAPVT